MKSVLVQIGLVSLGLSLLGCATAPTTPTAREGLTDSVQFTLAEWDREDPGLTTFLHSATGYVVFPLVGKGAAVGGGAYGRGEVFEHGQFIGYADMVQATVGAQVGGQTYAEVIAFETPQALWKFKGGQFALAANASAVAISAGASNSAKYDHGVVVFTWPLGGLMVEASIGGQNFSFQPIDSNATVSQSE